LVRPELIVVVAFGAILKPVLLTLAPLGAVNVHASLLPKYRGMSPIQRAIWDGETETGVTTIHMDAGVDTGDMILAEATPIAREETGGELHDRLSEIGARLLVETVDHLAAGDAPRRPQVGPASYAARLDKEDGYIDWTLEAEVVHNRARALIPWPGVTAFLSGAPVGIRRTARVMGDEEGPAAVNAAPGDEKGPAAVNAAMGDEKGPAAVNAAPGARGQRVAPGTILGVAAGALRVACGRGALDLLELRPAGKSTMSGADFAHGWRLKAGDRFDRPAPKGMSS
jgi:methionyl-tRNA formyltransferase